MSKSCKFAKCLIDGSAYEEYVKTVERAEFQARKLEKRRQERKNREVFSQFLAQKLKSREITHDTKWRDFVAAYKDEPAYLNLVG